MNAVDLLFFLRDHEILHIGWNLAIMDHFDTANLVLTPVVSARFLPPHLS